ncbi:MULTISPECIES: ATP-binding protein [Paenibacillus]|uniref:ATP-binding protein n=1 Tax=Paenibacillus TaxID=44249 RepID=UPI00096E43D4|nr:ATP-binding protein [Paenibacillus odorifer]OMD18499.1 hypothetical protein BJP50_14310 [Paenibacillus odorifer]
MAKKISATEGGKYVFTGRTVNANYIEQEEPTYQHNLWIEALPPILTQEEAYRKMKRYPVYENEERKKSNEARLHAVQRIRTYVEPLPMLLDLEERFSRMIRQGYLARNPIDAEYVRQMRAGFTDLEPGEIPVIRSSSAGFAVIGLSGMGKTTAVESVLTLYPQVIHHTQYNKTVFHRSQVVWLKLECPSNGSIKGLCYKFFQVLDLILGSDYYNKFCRGKVTTEELIQDVAFIASTLGLGVLIIDDIQHLNAAKSGGADTMLNFFVDLVNSIGIPVVLIGTNAVIPLLQGTFSTARRFSGQGDVIWSNHVEEDEVWDYFVEQLWRYQWTNKPTILTTALKKTLYDESQGIMDIAVKLYMLCQWSLIGADKEQITSTLIRNVAKESFQLLKPILEALKKKQIGKLAKIRDIYVDEETMDNFLKNSKERVMLHGSSSTMHNQKAANANEQESDPIMIVTTYLLDMDYKPLIAKEAAHIAVSQNDQATDIKKVIKDAMNIAFNMDTDTSFGELLSPDDMRALTKPMSETDHSSNYERLKEAGMIQTIELE